MPTPSLIRRRPPTARSGRKEALRDEGGHSRGEKNRAPAGDSNLATAAAFYRSAIQFDEVVSNLALMGFFEG